MRLKRRYVRLKKRHVRKCEVQKKTCEVEKKEKNEVEIKTEPLRLKKRHLRLKKRYEVEKKTREVEKKPGPIHICIFIYIYGILKNNTHGNPEMNIIFRMMDSFSFFCFKAVQFFGGFRPQHLTWSEGTKQQPYPPQQNLAAFSVEFQIP